MSHSCQILLEPRGKLTLQGVDLAVNSQQEAKPGFPALGSCTLAGF